MATEALTENLQETLELFEQSGAPRTTPEIAAELALGRRSTYDRLERLVDHGVLETKKVGANARVWWRPPAESTNTTAKTTGESVVADVIDGVEAGIFVLDSNFDIAWLNATAERYFGLDREQVLGRDKRQLIEERITSVVDDSERFAETVLQTYDDNTYVEEFECRVMASDNREGRWLEHRSSPIESGEYAGGRVELYYDITDRKHSEQTHKEFESLVNAVGEYAIFTLDAGGYVRTWNPGARQIKGYETDEILDEHISVFYTETDRKAGVPEENLTQAENSGSLEDEGWRVRADGSTFWANVTLTAIRGDDGELEGYAKVTQDMTDRKARERRLKRQREDLASELDDVFARIEDGFYAVDEKFRFTYVNDRAAELLQHTEEELLGRSFSDVFPELVETPAAEKFQTALETGNPTEYEFYFDQLGRWVEANVYPSDTGLSVYFRDVTERRERERQLARFERAVEAAGHAIYMTDTDGTITYVNPAFEEMTGYSCEEALGETPGLLDSGEHSDDYFARLWETINAGERWDEEITNQQKDGELYTAHQIISPVTGDSDTIDQFVAIQTDITERKAYERRLEAQIRQQEVVTELGQQALESTGIDTLMEKATTLVAETLDSEYCKVLDLSAEDDELLLRQGVGWDDGLVGEATVSAVEADSQAAYTLSAEQPVVVENLKTESRFSGPDLLTSHDVRSGISVVIGPHDDPWGILGAHDSAEREFSKQDVNFVQSVANILASALDRHEYEQQLLRHQEELAALNSLNELVREITSAAIEQSTREEVEEAVCEHLATSDSYLFAWIGEREVTTQTVRSRVEAGTDGYVDNITISLDPEDKHSLGPTGRALKTGETQVTRDIQRDPRYEPWREQASAHGFRSSAAVPIGHESTIYGVLNVYSQRPYAFGAQERTVITQLGEIIGHAIAATERKRALMSDELVELEFYIQNVFDVLERDIETEGTLTFEEVVPTGGDTYLVYGTATEDAAEALPEMVEALSHWGSVTVHGAGKNSRFELQMVDPPVLSAVSSLGGSIKEAVIENGNLNMTFHLSPTMDSGHIIDIVQETYPSAEMVARRQIERPDDTVEHLHEVLGETLTDRQRAALHAAYHAGFFEWPRDVPAEAVAESLGIAPSTFSQHLRKAEKKVFDILLSTSLSVGHQ